MSRSSLGNELVETRCVFCGSQVGRPGGCANGRHCHFCRTDEMRAADPCIPGRDHHWVRGHEFQRIPVQP